MKIIVHQKVFISCAKEICRVFQQAGYLLQLELNNNKKEKIFIH